MAYSIVVVDDEPSFLDVAQSVLSQYPGVTVVGTATSGEQALELYSALRPEFVIMDVQMPGMNGFETARRLRQEAADVRVLIISAHDEPQYEAIARDAGAEAFMTKKAFLSDGMSRFLG
jgi:two-component system NarL family response regulator